MKPSFTAGVYLENKIWFSDNSYNALMNLDIENEAYSFISAFPNEKTGQLLLHRNAICYNNKIVFTPNQGNNVHIFDIDTKKIESVSLCEKDHSRYYYSNGFIIDNKLWICPGSANYPFHIMDMNTRMVEKLYLNERFSDVMENAYLEEEHFFNWILFDGILMSPVIKNGVVIKCNTNTKELSCIDTKAKGVDSIYRTGNRVWLCGENSIFEWMITENKIKEYRIDENSIDPFELDSYRICGNEKIGIYAFRCCGGEILKLSNDSFSSKYQIGALKRTSNTVKGYWYDENEIINGVIVVFPAYESMMYFIKNDSLGVITATCSNVEKMKKQLFNKQLIVEGSIDLKEFLLII